MFDWGIFINTIEYFLPLLKTIFCCPFKHITLDEQTLQPQTTEMNTTVEDGKIQDLEINRYDLNVILKDNKFPKFNPKKIVDWNEAWFYSIIDLQFHPLKEKCMTVLEK